MNIESRISKLEDRAGITDQIPPLIVINATDCHKDSQDEGSPLLAVIPGQIGKFKGTTLSRDKDEAPADFLRRSEKKHSEFYA